MMSACVPALHGGRGNFCTLLRRHLVHLVCKISVPLPRMHVVGASMRNCTCAAAAAVPRQLRLLPLLLLSFLCASSSFGTSTSCAVNWRSEVARCVAVTSLSIHTLQREHESGGVTCSRSEAIS